MKILNPVDFVNNFIGKDEYNGVLRPERFVVHIQLPGLMKGKINEDVLIFNIESFQCPNLQMELAEIEINSIKHAYYKKRNDSNFSITFYESSEYYFRKFFYEWINLGFDMKKGIRKYIDDIIAPRVEIAPIGMNDSINNADVFEKVYPISINDLDYDYSKTGEILKTKVEFTYVYHTIEPSQLK